jgi:hypothetical protein
MIVSSSPVGKEGIARGNPRRHVSNIRTVLVDHDLGARYNRFAVEGVWRTSGNLGG